MAATTWTKFYWCDYTDDEALKLCSLGAQGLWMRMLAIAAVHDPVGYVSVNRMKLEKADLAVSVGRPVEEVGMLVDELEKWGVFSRKNDGTIYSRRMVRDEKKAKTARENGEKNQKIDEKYSESDMRLSDEKQTRIPASVGKTGPTEKIVGPPSGSIPITNSQIPIARSKKESISVGFTFPDFYAAFPRKVAKRAAEKAYIAALGRGVTPAQLLDGARRYAKTRDGEDAKYTKFPATWLNQDCYLDDIPDSPDGPETMAAEYWRVYRVKKLPEWPSYFPPLETIDQAIRDRVDATLERGDLESAGQQKLAL